MNWIGLDGRDLICNRSRKLRFVIVESNCYVVVVNAKKAKCFASK